MYWKHFKTISIHKYYVLIECIKKGLYWQGIVHDLSKFSFAEFFSSAKYFQGNKSSAVPEKAEQDYSSAWLHHKGHNKHHWEYWIDFEDGNIRSVKIPEKYIEEMVCDMIGASKAYNRGAYDPYEPLRYFNAHVNDWKINFEDEAKIRVLLLEAKNNYLAHHKI